MESSENPVTFSSPVYLNMNPSKEKKSSEAERFWHTFKKFQETHVAKDLINHGKNVYLRFSSKLA